MWINLAAGVFAPPTLSLSKSYDERISMLNKCVNELKKYRDEQVNDNPSLRWNNVSGRPSMIFVAPEYMFVEKDFKLQNYNDLKKNRFVEKADRDNIVAELQKISMKYGMQLVLAPGSIACREKLPANGTIDRMERVNLATQHISIAAEALQKRKFPSLLGDKYLDKTLAKPFENGKKKLPPTSPREKIKRLKTALTHKEAYYIADNVIYLFHKGRIVANYAKRADFHERLPLACAKTIFIPGIKKGRATIGGINFGLEICFDHGLGVLKDSPKVTPDLPRVHLLCSAAVKLKNSSVLVRDGGYFMHASSNEKYTRIRRKKGGSWEKPDKYETKNIGGFALKLGVIELDIPA